MDKNIIGLGFLGIAAFATFKSKSEISTKSNPKKRWTHSIPDSELPKVIASLAYLKSHPKKSDKVSESSLKYLVDEKWYDLENKKLTDLGNEFFKSITTESED